MLLPKTRLALRLRHLAPERKRNNPMSISGRFESGKGESDLFHPSERCPRTFLADKNLWASPPHDVVVEAACPAQPQRSLRGSCTHGF